MSMMRWLLSRACKKGIDTYRGLVVGERKALFCGVRKKEELYIIPRRFWHGCIGLSNENSTFGWEVCVAFDFLSARSIAS